MLKIAYSLKNNDPYIIDSIGWAYYLIEDYSKAEKFLKRAVELMPDDPIVNDHYGDILWKLNRKIQARYFWSNVLKMDDAETYTVSKITGRKATLSAPSATGSNAYDGKSVPWNFATSTTDGAAQVEEAGDDNTLIGTDDDDFTEDA